MSKSTFLLHFVLLIFSCLCLSCSSHYSQSPAEKLYLEGQHFLAKGNGSAALSCFQQSLELSRHEGYPAGVAHNLNEIAIYHTDNRNYAEARKLLTEALAIYRAEDMAVEVSKTMNNIATTYLREGEWSKAMIHYEELMGWDKQSGNRLGEGITLYNMGLLNGKWLDQPNLAFKQLRDALVIFRELNAEKYIQAVEKILSGSKTEN